jgi:hypothetical protein
MQFAPLFLWTCCVQSCSRDVIPVGGRTPNWQEVDAVPSRLFATPVHHQMSRRIPSRDRQLE